VEKRLLVAHQFGLCVAHMGCATIATPLVKFISGASQYAPHIICLCVVHIAICATSSLCKFKKFKKIKNREKSIFFENHKNRNNVKKTIVFQFFEDFIT
jgi:hypothetical protein